jgi:4-amino-4-deoxy-L-arabinose transferase-like glycosyltransferase
MDRPENEPTRPQAETATPAAVSRLWLALEVLLVVALAFVARSAVVGHQREDSVTSDEALHVFAGFEYVANGTYWTNPEHPPLLKALGGGAGRTLDVEPPSGGDTRDGVSRNSYLDFFYRNRAPAHDIVASGRRPFPWLLFALVVVVWLIGRSVWSRAAGLLAAGVIAVEPNLVAHAGFVHTDVGVTLGMTATLGAALVAARRESWGGWIGSGLLLGVTLASKFTALLLLPMIGIVLLLAWRSARPEDRRRRLLRGLAGAGVAGLLALGVVVGVYKFTLRNMEPARAAQSIGEYLARREGTSEQIERYERLSRSVPALGHFVGGYVGVRLLSANGRGSNFLHGRVSETGFPQYFPVAFLLKSTPAFLFLVLLMLVLGRGALVRYEALGLLLPVLLFFAVSAGSTFNIGVRHILPVYPLLAVTAAGILCERLRRRHFAILALLLVGAGGASLARVHPFEIGYFNFLAGGFDGGPRWLGDSNVDWGQDLARLERELRRRGWENDTTIVSTGALGTLYYSPGCRKLGPEHDLGPGHYAVSDLMEKVGPQIAENFDGVAAGEQVAELLSRLRSHGRRVGRVGAGIWLWELPPHAPPVAE